MKWNRQCLFGVRCWSKIFRNLTFVDYQESISWAWCLQNYKDSQCHSHHLYLCFESCCSHCICDYQSLKTCWYHWTRLILNLRILKTKSQHCQNSLTRLVSNLRILKMKSQHCWDHSTRLVSNLRTLKMKSQHCQHLHQIIKSLWEL